MFFSSSFCLIQPFPAMLSHFQPITAIPAHSISLQPPVLRKSRSTTKKYLDYPKAPKVPKSTILLVKTLHRKMCKKLELKYAHKVSNNGQKVKKKNTKKIMNFLACMYKSQKFSKSQLNFVLSHDSERVTFRNFAQKFPKRIPKDPKNIANYPKSISKVTQKYPKSNPIGSQKYPTSISKVL